MLTEAGVDNPALDARLLLAHLLGTDQAGLLRDREAPIDNEAYQTLLTRRAAREPVALIRGWQEFWSLRFAVSPDTLIPRADSETLIEAAVQARPDGAARILDLGTGTGCLLLAALSEFPKAWGVGVDHSSGAAALARRNAAALGLARRTAIVCGNWAAPLAGTFDLVLSNPPYIETCVIAGLMPEVARFEPRSALDGGPDGLQAYRALLGSLPVLLAPGGVAVLEVGAGQAHAVGLMARDAGFTASTRADLGGISRAILLHRA